MPDQIAVLDVVASRRGAFALVYADHRTSVYRYTLALTESHQDAEDVTAETFERAYLK